MVKISPNINNIMYKIYYDMYNEDRPKVTPFESHRHFIAVRDKLIEYFIDIVNFNEQARNQLRIEGIINGYCRDFGKYKPNAYLLHCDDHFMQAHNKSYVIRILLREFPENL